ncbi:MAG: hypothetical protein ACTSU5_10375 [Promethearchaeota archaeon]
MGTHCYIGMEYKDQTIEAIFCHYDGGPYSSGDLLFHKYKNRAQIQRLIDHGDISSLGPTPETSRLTAGREYRGEEKTIDEFSSQADEMEKGYWNLKMQDGRWLVVYWRAFCPINILWDFMYGENDYDDFPPVRII